MLELARVRSAPMSRAARRGHRARNAVTAAGLLVLASATVAALTTDGKPHAAPAAASRHPAAATPTPTPAPVEVATLAPTRADARTADFVVGGGPFSIVVTAGGPCWLEVRDARRQVVFVGTLAPGETKQFSGTDLRLRLGAAGNVTLQVNGSSLDLPVRTPDPYNVRIAQTA